MKIKENFTLRNIAGRFAVLPLGAATLDFTGLLTLNESGVLLWNRLASGCSREELAAALTEEYDVSAEEAHTDADAFIRKLSELGCIDYEA